MKGCTGGVLLALASQATAAYTFFGLGDWGGADLGKPVYDQNVNSVAQAMANVAKNTPPEFVIGTGDNFYYCGIQNKTDPQIQKDWLTPYAAVSPSLLDVPWYNVLGNHEYGYNVTAQIDMSWSYTNWVLPARHYSRRVNVGGDQFITLVFIDSNPCVSAYRSNDSSGWDPCAPQFPTCSIDNTDDDFEGPCEFHANIISQDCTTQFVWFEQTLQDAPADDWVIVVGHHPADEVDVVDIITPMEKRKVSLYVNGHAHTLTQYAVNGKGSYVTTGAGAMVVPYEKNTRDRSVPSQDRTYRKEEGIAVGSNVHNNNYTQIWNDKVSGFTVHTLSDDMSTLTTQYYDTNGNVIHTFAVDKQGNPTGNGPPSPAPPGPSPSGGSCCFYHDDTCTKGQTCCKSECNDPSTCSYTQEGCSSSYGAAHHCTWTGSSCVVGS